jgi:hypothetical protein
MGSLMLIHTIFTIKSQRKQLFKALLLLATEQHGEERKKLTPLNHRMINDCPLDESLALAPIEKNKHTAQREIFLMLVWINIKVATTNDQQLHLVNNV